MAKYFMRAFVGTFLIVLASFFVVSSSTAVQAQEAKIGVIIPQALLASSEIGKKAAARLKTQKEEAQAKLDSLTDELKGIQDDLMKRAMMLNDEEKKKAAEDMERRQRDAARTKEDLERSLQQTEREVLGEVNEFLSGAMAQFGEKNGFDLIVDAQAAVYFSEKTDVTDAAIEFIDKEYKPKKK
jgi:outer membrane protein